MNQYRKLPPPHEFLKNSSGIEVKGFGNKDEDQKNIILNLQKLYPDMQGDELDKYTGLILGYFYNRIDSELRNSNSFVHLDKPLPEGTDWSNLRIHITSCQFDLETKKRILRDCKVEIFLMNERGEEKRIKYTSFHEMLLEDTVKRSVSVGGLLLLIFSTGKDFSWSTKNIPRSYRVAKTRLSKDLERFFGLNSDPIYRNTQNNTYSLKLKITSSHSVMEQFGSFSIDSVLSESYESDD